MPKVDKEWWGEGTAYSLQTKSVQVEIKFGYIFFPIDLLFQDFEIIPFFFLPLIVLELEPPAPT